MTSRNLAQSQQEANELGESSNPSSHASYQPPVGAGPVGAAGGHISQPLAASLYCPVCGSDAIDEDGICHGCGGRVGL